LHFIILAVRYYAGYVLAYAVAYRCTCRSICVCRLCLLFFPRFTVCNVPALSAAIL